MPIHHVCGDLLEQHDATWRIVTCNTVGAMGAGIALQCKMKFPAVYRNYHAAAKAGAYQPGGLYYASDTSILLAMTKAHYADPSRIEWVDSILVALRDLLINHPGASVAMPPLGAGHGGLDGRIVLDHVHRILGDLSADIYYYLPR